MRSSFLPFSQPCIDEKDIGAVVRVMRSKWITTGAECAELESEFSRLLGCRGSVALASATAGMHLLLSALGVGPGDEVITPSMTWVSTPNLITLCGAAPVWVDIDQDDLMTTAELVKPLINERTKAIIPVHFAGAPVHLDPFRTLAERHGIPLIEDAAHAIGTEYKGDIIGKTGTAVFSLHPIKNMTTGEGGMFCSNDEQLLARIRRLKFHGLGVDAFDRETQGRKPQAQVVEPGYKYNLTDMAAAMGRTQLRRLEKMNLARTVLAEWYSAAFADIPEILPLKTPTWPHKHSWSLYVVRLNKPGLSRETFMERLKSRNIGTGIHFLAAHTHAFYRSKYKSNQSLENTEWNSERILSLPLFPEMSEEDVADVVFAVKEALVRD